MEGVSYATGGWRAAVLVIISSIVVWRCLGILEGILVSVAGLATLIDDALKIAINRSRPIPDLVTVYVAETGKSFPSGLSHCPLIFKRVSKPFAWMEIMLTDKYSRREVEN
jgi:hypothetical protein